WAGLVTSIFVRNAGCFGFDIERLARFLRADQAVSPLVERIHGRDRIGLVLLGEIVVDGFERRAAADEARIIDAAGKRQVLHLKGRIGRIRAEAEWCERRAEVAAGGEL